MSKRIVILGAGGNSRDIVDLLLDINDASGELKYDPLGYLDDDPEKLGTELGGYAILGPLSRAIEFADCHFINSINGTKLMSQKPAIIAGTRIPLDRFETVVHPTASVSRMARLGCGSVVFQNVSICSNARVGNHVTILPNTVVAHDCVVEDECYLTPSVSLSGYVHVARAAYLGNNSTRHVPRAHRRGGDRRNGQRRTCATSRPERRLLEFPRKSFTRGLRPWNRTIT